MNRRAPWMGLACLGAWLALTMLHGTPTRAGAEHSYGLLVVTHGQDAATKSLEKDIYRILGLLREKAEIDRIDLPIISYHLDKPGEKAHCEKVLGIKPAHLVFVGLVEQEAFVARKVVYRVNNVTDSFGACVKVVTQAARVLGRNPANVQPQASPSPSPSAAPPAASGTPGVSLQRVDLVNAQAQVQQVFATTDSGVYVNVFLHNDRPDREHRHALGVKITGPDGKLFGRVLGGSFTVAAGEKLETVEMLRRADPGQHNGFLIAGRTLSRNPGDYAVAVEIDGRPIARTRFTVSAEPATRPSTGPELEVVSAWIGDESRTHRYTYSTSDAGLYIYVLLRNRTPERRHQHRLRVTCFDPKGAAVGRPLGGAFVVEPGDDLSKKDFPRDADEERHNGFLIKGHRLGRNPGPYRVVIELDEQKIKEMHFRITD